MTISGVSGQYGRTIATRPTTVHSESFRLAAAQIALLPHFRYPELRSYIQPSDSSKSSVYRYR